MKRAAGNGDLKEISVYRRPGRCFGGRAGFEHARLL
jgi:hypothetical protein